MDVNQFLDPKDEVVKDDIERPDEQILAQFGPEIEAESVEEIEVLPKISNADALEALKKLQLYEEQQDSGNRGFIQALNRHERVTSVRRALFQQQRDIFRHDGPASRSSVLMQKEQQTIRKLYTNSRWLTYYLA
ncbi:hypothetical protein VTO42DRAFT_6034 [Malbranchea cinnamomea]